MATRAGGGRMKKKSDWGKLQAHVAFGFASPLWLFLDISFKPFYGYSLVFCQALCGSWFSLKPFVALGFL